MLYAIGVGFRNSYVSTTQHWLPCYDHPSDKATLNLQIEVPSNLNVASVGLLTSAMNSADQTKTTFRWEELHECATYLYTFAVGRFTRMDFAPVDGIPVHVYSRPRDTSASRVSYKLVPRMTQEESRLFGPYPFDKVGYVNTPIGAMEHQTMVSFPISLVNLRDTVNTTAAHELAHQWFGDLVTPLDFRHAWLTESFATYTEAAWVEHIKGWDAYLAAIAASARNYITGVARDEGVFALYDFPRASPSSNYPVTIYRKGQNVVAMARALCGSEAFYSRLQRYLEAYKYGTATTENMKEELRPALGSLTDTFFDEWVLGKGWPRIEVDIRQGGSQSHTVTLRQTQHNEFAGWPVFTTLPLNVTYRDPVSDALIDTMFIITSSEFTFEVGSLNGFALNSGSKCRSLVEIIKTTSVAQESNSHFTCSVYPSPAHEEAVLNFTGNTSEMTVTMYSISGSHVYNGIVAAGASQYSIPTVSIPSGQYSIILECETVVLTIPASILH